MQCYCGGTKPFSECCEPYLNGQALAPNPEALMRSRYTAHVKKNIDYLRSTLVPKARTDFDAEASKEWAEKAEWLGLEILSARSNKVEFVAKYRIDGKTLEHHEVSTFIKHGDRWFFVDGDSHVHEEGQGHDHHHEAQTPSVRQGPKVGRNDPCTCGSGKKFKKCCGN
ncbi:MAG TPA: YchJ family protein [Oligoflexia bacterium]|nr:YchJ family protein [Oligoflexia bacterium]